MRHSKPFPFTLKMMPRVDITFEPRKKSRTCRIPLMAQKVRNQGREFPAPKAMLTAAVAMRPPASMTLGDVRAPRTPLTNLENP